MRRGQVVLRESDQVAGALGDDEPAVRAREHRLERLDRELMLGLARERGAIPSVA
jgi:hypothetical protein